MAKGSGNGSHSTVATRELCLRLMRADTQDDVVGILTDAGYWTDAESWRLFDDNENNYSTIGNQQSRSEAALVEKIVNSIDARLVNACIGCGTDPASSTAPQTIREAVARFFEDRKGELGPDAGRVKTWAPPDRSREARLITVSATGFSPTADGYPCLTIADAGEGQVPGQFPDTFLSLNRSNKLRIPFVQGKFNMGGTGALQFAGKHNLQLIVSRRNPALLPPDATAEDRRWGFTIVRREDPNSDDRTARRRSSTYTYLAPGRSVLSFDEDAMPIFPEGQDAYKRTHQWGTLIKLYEYETKGFRSNIVSAGQGLLRRIDLLLPEVALPIRLYECRAAYKGHKGSFETNVTGVGVRLEDDRHDNLEAGFPASAVISAMGEPMKVSIFAFKRGKAEEYRMQQGVIFAINGQTHGHLPVDFFRRRAVGMSYLADSLFVMVDCSGIGGRSREDLFMNSRDRLRENALRYDIEDQLENVIKSNQGLRDLANRRRQEDIAAKLQDSKPLVETLEKLIKQSPALASLFNLGIRISNPFAPTTVATTDKFEGKLFPTYFRFRDRPYGVVLTREAFLNRRPRIVFETDAENSYFSRDVDPGQVEVQLDRDGSWSPITSFSLNLHNGVGNLNCPLPHDAKVEDELTYRVRVTDSSRIEPFENTFTLRVRPSATAPPPTRGTGEKKKPPSKEKGTEREKPSALAMPPITPVEEKDWDRYGFDKTTALKVRHAGGSDPDSPTGGTTTYDFFVNVDNQYLRAEQKRSTLAASVLRAKFTYAIVLIGLALLQEDRSRPARDGDDTEGADEAGGSVEKRIDQVASAIAPVLLPMLDLLSDVGEEAA